MTDITVIGGGYVGLVTGVCLAELGHRVTILEIDTAKVKSLRENIMPIYESGLEQLWRRHTENGRLQVTSDYEQGLLAAKMVFLTVGTPSRENGETDLRYVMDALKRMAKDSRGTPILVIKSTVPVGTGRAASKALAAHSQTGFWPVVSNPEFLREGHAIADFLEPHRIVLGSDDKAALKTVSELYQPLESPMVLTDNSTAELIKYASNAFLATKISFINEISQLANQLGVDIGEVAKGVGMDHRIGPSFLQAGLGWGGSCFPKDINSLLKAMERNHLPAPLLNSVKQVNAGQVDWVVQELFQLMGPLSGRRIAIWGLAFKAGTDDTRDSPALKLIAALDRANCSIRAYDPQVPTLDGGLGASVTLHQDPYSAVSGADALVLATDWPEFRSVNWQLVHEEMRSAIIFDGRNFLDPEELSSLGFTYAGVARGELQHAARKPLLKVQPEQRELTTRS